MPKAEKKDEVKEGVTLESIAKQINDMAAKIRRMSDNWKVFCSKHLGSEANDGKLGRANIGVLVGMAVVAITIGVVRAEPVDCWYDGDATWGTSKMDSDLAGSITYTVNKVVASGGVTAPVTGDITCDDITANGGATATLDINMPTTQATNTVTTKLGIVGDSSQTIQYDIVSGTNDSAETISYLKRTLTVTDYTTNTEDSTYGVTVMVGGTEREVLSLSSAVTIGSGNETVAVNSSDWDIDSSGNASGLGTVAADGDVDLSATGGSTGDPDLGVSGYAKFSGTVELDGPVQVDGAQTNTAAVVMQSTLSVSTSISTPIVSGSSGYVAFGNSILTNINNLFVTGVLRQAGKSDFVATGGTTGDPDVDVDGYANFDGTVEMNGPVQVDGALTTTAAVVMNAGATVSSGQTLTLSGVTVTGWGAVSSGVFSNATMGGTLTVDCVQTNTGAVVLQSTLDVTGTLSSSNQTVNGVITGKGSATIDNTTDGAILNLTEDTVKVTGAFNATGAATFDSTVTSAGLSLARIASAQVTGGVPQFFTTNVTMHAGTVWTQALTFTGAILGVQATATESVTAWPYANSVATNEVQITVEADKNFSLLVIGY